MLREHGLEVQRLFLNFMLGDPQNYIRVQNIFNPANFDKGLRDVASFIKEYSEQFKSLPTPVQLKATLGFVVEEVPDISENHSDWFLDEFESFTKRKELERAILQAADYLEKGNFDPVEKLIKDAVQISLTKDMGTDYYRDPRGRLEQLKDRNGMVSTGWADLDELLYGGFNRGDLQIFAGGSGSGKSLVMQNLALNWSAMGLNGAYLSLELSENLCAMRLDSMSTEIITKDILRNVDEVELRVRMLSKKHGGLQIKYMPAQSTVNDIRAYLKELEIQTGKKVDFLCVDYLDLLMPVSAKVSPSDLFVKDKYVSEELRNLAKELNVLFVTASQLNRSAVDELEFDHSHISGGISKINTADNVFGIFTSLNLRERGRYQIQAMKTRSSAGVGKKVELGFNPDTLRIFNLAPEDKDQSSFANRSTGQQITDSIRRVKAAETVDMETGEIKTAPAGLESQRSKLTSMLSRIKQT